MTSPHTPLGAPSREERDINLSPARAAWMAENIDDRTRELLTRDERVYLRQSLSTPCLNVLAGASGAWITDVSGRRILDFHGNSVHQVGHAHPQVLDAVRRQLSVLPFCPRRFTCEPAIELAERLGSLTNGHLTKVLFAPGGTSAMGIAMKLARIVTGRTKFVSLQGSFHGASLDAISIGGEALFRGQAGPLLPGCVHIPPPRTEDCAEHLDVVLSREDDVAAFIAEPIRCTTVHSPPPGYWARARRVCERHGVLLVFDEIPVWLGRTGDWFAHQTFGVVPDISVIGKGLGGGVVPMAAVLARPEFDVAPHLALGHYTHEKNPLGAAAGLAAIDVVEREGLCQRARVLGAELAARVRGLGCELVCDVRQVGLLVGVELGATPTRTGPDVAERVLYECLRAGLSFKVSDGTVLTLTPPLTLLDCELDRAIQVLEQSLTLAAGAKGGI